MFKWNYFILDNKVKWNIHDIWPISVENVQPYIGTACTPKNLLFFAPPRSSFTGVQLFQKSTGTFGLSWMHLFFFFPATIFKNLQPSDFLHCASTHQHGVTEKKRATGWSTTIIALMVTFHANAAVTFSCISRLNRWLNSPRWKRKQQAERIFSPLKSIFWDYFVWKCGSSFAVGREN